MINLTKNFCENEMLVIGVKATSFLVYLILEMDEDKQGTMDYEDIKKSLKLFPSEIERELIVLSENGLIKYKGYDYTVLTTTIYKS